MSERKGPREDSKNYTHLTSEVCRMLMRAGKQYSVKAPYMAVQVDVDFSVDNAGSLMHGDADSYLLMAEDGNLSVIDSEELKKSFVKFRQRSSRKGQKTTLAPKIPLPDQTVTTSPDATDDDPVHHGDVASE